MRAPSAPRTPDNFENAQLFMQDFDNTVALTFETSPAGIGVHEAHELTVEQMFGPAGLQRYLSAGGLLNRSAHEVVKDLVDTQDDSELAELVECFINAKLGIILGQIGTRFADDSVWPRPMPGYLRFRGKLARARESGQQIDDFILSSGHEPFIKKTFEVWGTTMPDFIVSEDYIRGLDIRGISMDELVKPSPRLVDIAGFRWQQSYGIKQHLLTDEERARILYAGDDPVKDGQMARAAGVDFELIDTEAALETWQRLAVRLRLGQMSVRGAHHG